MAWVIPLYIRWRALLGRCTTTSARRNGSLVRAARSDHLRTVLIEIDFLGNPALISQFIRKPGRKNKLLQGTNRCIFVHHQPEWEGSWVKRVSLAVLLVVTMNLATMFSSAQFGHWVSKRMGANEYGAVAISAGAGYVGGAAGAWAGAKAGALLGAAGGPVGAFIGGGIGAVGGAL